jgi:hypothetical protein
VRAAQISETESNLDLGIASGGYRFHAFPKMPLAIDPQRLVGARVRLRGTSGAFFNQEQRRLTALKLFMTSLPEDFVVEATESVDPFTEPCWLSIISRNIAKTRGRATNPRQRHGLPIRPGQELFLQDASGGCAWKAAKSRPIRWRCGRSGRLCDIENFLPVLQDAVFRKTSEPTSPWRPRPSRCSKCKTVCATRIWSRCKASCWIGFVRQDHQPAAAKCGSERS